MAAQRRWLPNVNGGPTTIAAWSSISPHESASVAGGTTQEHKAIAMRDREGASVSRGTLQEHEAILNCKQACENVSVSRETPQEHKAILDREAKEKSKGSNCTPLKV